MPRTDTPSDQPDHAEKRRARKREVSQATREFRRRLDVPVPDDDLPVQAIFHWGLDDQEQALLAAREAEPKPGFMMRLLALCTLPRTNPGDDQLQYRRVNGPFALIMTATDSKLPYGTLPRLLLAWLCSEAVRTQSRVIHLGRSLADFLRKLGIDNDSGGARGYRTRVRDQMDRLFGANVRLTIEEDGRKRFVSSNIADKGDLWWDPRGDQPVLWDSTIRLGEQFYEEIRQTAVPLDMHILRAIKRSALGIDIYLWLTYRMFTLKEPKRLTWPQLYRQFGANPGKTDKRTVDNFRTDFLRELRKIEKAWPQLDCRVTPGALLLRPSPPRIAPVDRRDDEDLSPT